MINNTFWRQTTDRWICVDDQYPTESYVTSPSLLANTNYWLS